MKTRSVNILWMTAAGISFLLAVGCVWAWFSTRHDLYLTGWGDPAPGHAFWTFGSAGGLFQLVYDNMIRGVTPLGHWEFLGIEYGTYKSGWNVWIPWWVPTLLFMILPALWTYRTWRHTNRTTDGICPACGYDLHATPDRCPECGRTTGDTSE